MVIASKHFLYFGRIQLATPTIEASLTNVNGVLWLAATHSRVFPHLPKRWVQVTLILLVLSKFVDFTLEFLYFREIVVFAYSFSLKLLTSHFKILYNFLQPLPLFLLLTKFSIDLFDFLEHLIQTIFHFLLTLVPLGQLLLNTMIFKLQLFDFQHLLLYFRSVLVVLVATVGYFERLAEFFSSDV